jgi:hypothetical protein
MNETLITVITIVPEGKELFCKEARKVEIIDDGQGEIVVVCHPNIQLSARLEIKPQDWPDLRDAIERLVNRCRG